MSLLQFTNLELSRCFGNWLSRDSFPKGTVLNYPHQATGIPLVVRFHPPDVDEFGAMTSEDPNKPYPKESGQVLKPGQSLQAPGEFVQVWVRPAYLRGGYLPAMSGIGLEEGSELLDWTVQAEAAGALARPQFNQAPWLPYVGLGSRGTVILEVAKTPQRLELQDGLSCLITPAVDWETSGLVGVRPYVDIAAPGFVEFCGPHRFVLNGVLEHFKRVRLVLALSPTGAMQRTGAQGAPYVQLFRRLGINPGDALEVAPYLASFYLGNSFSSAVHSQIDIDCGSPGEACMLARNNKAANGCGRIDVAAGYQPHRLRAYWVADQGPPAPGRAVPSLIQNPPPTLVLGGMCLASATAPWSPVEGWAHVDVAAGATLSVQTYDASAMFPITSAQGQLSNIYAAAPGAAGVLFGVAAGPPNGAALVLATGLQPSLVRCIPTLRAHAPVQLW